MTGAWIRFGISAGCMVLGLVFMVSAVFGVNRFKHALNRMHAAALGDTLGILFVILGLIIIRGFSMDSLKLSMVIMFFWIASPVSGHMISRLEAMTDERLGEITVLEKNNGILVDMPDEAREDVKTPAKKKKAKRGGKDR
ncbi:MAG: monovalent cation/H(+) antiporter subunit G [Hungatella sp.]|jgi:multicomponent Na+:H+ antiporter subunit G|nr:monovalent cation/H(+) antiporter subunit G [Hungatella sp.]